MIWGRAVCCRHKSLKEAYPQRPEAVSHGCQPWLSAMAVSHGCQPWLSAMAASHGRQPRPPTMAASNAHFREAIFFGGQTLHSHASGGFQAMRPRKSDSPGEVIVCSFFFVPNGPLEAPAVQKTYFFPRLWLLHFSRGKNIFLKIHVVNGCQQWLSAMADSHG